MQSAQPPKVLDLFAGAGGFGLGFQLAGYRLIGSVELDEWAVGTLQANNPDSNVLQADIRDYQSSSAIEQAFTDKPDVIIGGPPCQGFSISGPRQKDPKDPRNSLFQDFARWVGALRPTIFVMENVTGLLLRKNAAGEQVIDIIRGTFTKLGYHTQVWILNAAEYGVPQTRIRVFVIGNRLDIAEIPEPPTSHYLAGARTHKALAKDHQTKRPTRARTLWDAISDLPKLVAGEGQEEQPYTQEPRNDYQRWSRGTQATLYNHVTMRHTTRIVRRFQQIEWGQSADDMHGEHIARKRNGNGVASDSAYHQNNRRLHPFRPSHTIPAYFYSSFIHPYQHRNLTAREGARIQSFPDWYRFTGKRTVISSHLLRSEGRLEDHHLSQYNQIGNAVPPLLAYAIANHIQQHIFAPAWLNEGH